MRGVSNFANGYVGERCCQFYQIGYMGEALVKILLISSMGT